MECRVAMLNGDVVVIPAERSWKMWQLRKEISNAKNIPEYELSIFQGDVQLHSNDPLVDTSKPEGDVVHISLFRSCPSRTLSAPQLQQLWQGFMEYSTDNGETLDLDDVHRIVRSAGMFKAARRLDDTMFLSCDMPAAITFAQLLALVSPERDAPRFTMEEAERYLEQHDPRNTGRIPHLR
eukprot:TRINITY_DN13336_c0_g1_i2.p1 TRINITY_DN13336_c0_g1~~TRINITY_DN13336_c0_g1_i2.p1  ORF type:complete len:181 (+),score=21.80 TRINITY_DN13336_c0_g1_i2:68-610(+)